MQYGTYVVGNVMNASGLCYRWGTRIVLLGLRCLSAFNERDVPYIMSHLTTLVNMGKTGQLATLSIDTVPVTVRTE
eukprot:4871421-Amphidinium_carterae.1